MTQPTKKSASAYQARHINSSLRRTERSIQECLESTASVENQLSATDAVLDSLNKGLTDLDQTTMKSKAMAKEVVRKKQREAMVLWVSWIVFGLALLQVWGTRVVGIAIL